MDDEEEDNTSEDSNNSASYQSELHVEGVKITESEMYPPLSTLNKIVVRCILNECIDQLYILRNINTQDNANFIHMSVDYVSIAER